MAERTIQPRWVARIMTALLWGVGSAHLIKTELAVPSPDYVMIGSVPIIWAVVIALPVMAALAFRAWRPLTAVLLIGAALIGSAYTINGTLTRQSEQRDTRSAAATAAATQRQQLLNQIESGERELSKAVTRCGTGKTCSDATLAAISVHEDLLTTRRARLASMSFAAPNAGEKRIAALLAALTGRLPADLEPLVGMIVPALFGLFCEFAAMATAMMGWHPEKVAGKGFRHVFRRRLPENDTTPPPSGRKNVSRETLPANVVPLKHPVIAALEKAGRSVNNGELAELMGVCDGEATKRRREVAGKLHVERVGRECKIALKA